MCLFIGLRLAFEQAIKGTMFANPVRLYSVLIARLSVNFH